MFSRELVLAHFLCGVLSLRCIHGVCLTSCIGDHCFFLQVPLTFVSCRLLSAYGRREELGAFFVILQWIHQPSVENILWWPLGALAPFLTSPSGSGQNTSQQDVGTPRKNYHGITCSLTLALQPYLSKPPVRPDTYNRKSDPVAPRCLSGVANAFYFLYLGLQL